MKRILIVDDEQVVREGLRAIIQKNFPSIQIVEGKNGKIAIEKAQSFQPDLILMDIKMPGMDGLETIVQIKKITRNVKFIMISAYAEFEYAQQAMQLGVGDYLLKPSKASEVVKTIQKMSTLIEREKQSEQEKELQDQTLQKALMIVEADIVTQLLFDHMHEFYFEELVELLGTSITNEKFVISVLLPEQSEGLYTLIKQRVKQMSNAWVGAQYGRQIPIIIFKNQHESFRHEATMLAREILYVAKEQNKQGWFVGIGNVYQTFDLIRQSYQESLIATKNTALPVKYLFYLDISSTEKKNEGLTMKQLENKIFDQIRSGEWQTIIKEISELIGFYEQNQVPVSEAQQRILELLWVASRVLNEIGIIPETPIYSLQIINYKQLRTETNQLLNHMWNSHIEYHSQMEKNTIKQIRQYIIEHSHEDISLDRIARKYQLSPIYISTLFKEQIGINYITFLTECRLEKAKKLMLDPEKSLKEITFEVGYQDPNYFSKVFKRTFQISPTEYRKSLLGGRI